MNQKYVLESLCQLNGNDKFENVYGGDKESSFQLNTEETLTDYYHHNHYEKVLKGFKGEEPSYFESSLDRGFLYEDSMQSNLTTNDSENMRWDDKQTDDAGANSPSNLVNGYGVGMGIKKDAKETARSCPLTAKQRQARGQYNLGWCYQNGLGVEKNLKEAVWYYELAAEKGHALAQHNLGLCYQNGLGVEKNLAEAIRYYKLAADQGHTDAQTNLALCHQNGRGIKRNLEESACHYQSNTMQRNTTAHYYEWDICYENGNGMNKDVKEAIQYYPAPLKQGHTEPQNNLGTGYQNDLGMKRNLKEAVNQRYDGAKNNFLPLVKTYSYFNQRASYSHGFFSSFQTSPRKKVISDINLTRDEVRGKDVNFINPRNSHS